MSFTIDIYKLKVNTYEINLYTFSESVPKYICWQTYAVLFWITEFPTVAYFQRALLAAKQMLRTNG